MPRLRAADAPGVGSCSTRTRSVNGSSTAAVPSVDALSTTMISHWSRGYRRASSDDTQASIVLAPLNTATTTVAPSARMGRYRLQVTRLPEREAQEPPQQPRQVRDVQQVAAEEARQGGA